MHTASSRLKREEADRLLTHRRRNKSLLSSQSTSLMALVPMRWEASKNLKDIQVLKQHIIVVKSVHVDWSFYSTFVLYASTQNFFKCLSGFFFFNLTFTLWWMHQRVSLHLAQGYLARRLDQPGIKPTTFQVVDDLLHLLSHINSFWWLQWTVYFKGWNVYIANIFTWLGVWCELICFFFSNPHKVKSNSIHIYTRAHTVRSIYLDTDTNFVF